MIEVFLTLHPVIQGIAIVVTAPLLFIFALLAILLIVVLIEEIATKVANCHANHCKTKIAVAAARKEKE